MRRVTMSSRRWFPLLATPFLAPLLASACAAPDAGPASLIVFEGARVIVGDGSDPIENATLVVENGRITQVGAQLDAPASAARVDLTGKTVMPAIVNAHMHLSGTREELIGQLEHNTYYGAGAVVSLGTDSSAASFALKDEPAPGAARLLTAGRGITAPEPGRGEVPYWVTTEAEARQAVQELAAKPVGIVKIWVDDRGGQYTKLAPNLYGAVIDEAHNNGLKVIAHIFALADAKDLLRAGIDAFAHSVRDLDVDDEFVTLVQERPEVVLVPNLPNRGVAVDLSWLSGTIPAAELAEMQARAVDNPDAQLSYGIQARNLDRLNEAGMRIAFGTDGGSPWAAHLEMEDMVAAGMTPAEVIMAATRSSAEHMGLADMGTLAEGKSADFIVLNANPLDDITNTRQISAVYLRGVEVDRDAISARLTGEMAVN